MPGSSYVDKGDKREGAVHSLTGGEPAPYQREQAREREQEEKGWVGGEVI